MEYLKRTWAEVDLDAIEENYRNIKSLVAPAEVIAIVKADAYGHGADEVSALLSSLGVKTFAVSNIDEAAHLRRYGIGGDILILGYTPPSLAARLASLSLTQTVYDLSSAEALSESAKEAGVTLPVHIKADTGMSRLGILCQSEEDLAPAVEEALAISRLGALRVTGLFTHFSVSDDLEDDFTERQLARFLALNEALAARGLHIPLRHAANSGGALGFADSRLDAVRPGIILYGYYPDSLRRSAFESRLTLRPSMTLKTVISQVKTIKAGATVSYGRTYAAESERTLAVVPIGYADGFIRRCAKDAVLFVRGKPAPVVGRICMDMCILDITGIEGAAPGDEVVVFGKNGGSLEAVADAGGTVNYEITCLIGKRVPRVYIRNGVETGVANAFMGRE